LNYKKSKRREFVKAYKAYIKNNIKVKINKNIKNYCITFENVNKIVNNISKA